MHFGWIIVSRLDGGAYQVCGREMGAFLVTRVLVTNVGVQEQLSKF